MIMTDTISANLSVDYSSIRIVTDPVGAAVPYSLSGGKNEDGTSNGTTIATYTVPDETKVEITYRAYVRGNGEQTIVNKVSVNGKDKTVTHKESYTIPIDGEAAVAAFNIVKVDGHDANKKLEGVKFKIFAEDSELDFGEKANHAKEIILTTDQNGVIVLDGDQYDFYFDECYHVQEIEPLDNYSPISFDYLVTLTTDMSKVDYPHFIYYYSDPMQIKNWPLEGLVVEKQVESDESGDHERYYDFEVSILKDNGEVNTEYNGTNGDDDFVNGVAKFKLKDKEQKIFWGFTEGTKFRVEEKLGETDAEKFTVFTTVGETTEESKKCEGEISGDYTLVTFKNQKKSTTSELTVQKTLQGNAAQPDKVFNFNVTFDKSDLAGVNGSYKIGTAENIENAAPTDISFTEGQAIISYELIGGQMAVFSDLPDGTNFTVEEISKDQNGYETTVSSDGGTVDVANKTVTGTISSTAAVTVSYVNKKATTETEATKAWKYGDTEIAWPEDVESVEFTLYKTVNGETTPVVAEDLTNYWADTSLFENPIKVRSNTEGKKASWADLPTRMLVTTTTTWTDVTYSVKETKINYTEASRTETVDVAADENKLITNSPKTSIHVSKEWQGKDGTVLQGAQIPENSQVIFTLLANGTAVTKTVEGETTPVNRTVTLNGTDATNNGIVTPTSEDYEGANWTAYFTNLPVYDSDGKIIKYTVEETGTWSGYVVVTTGDGIIYPAEDNGKIINKETSLSLDILKVNKAGTAITTGAKFRIVQINDTLQGDDKQGTEKIDTTGNDGKLTFDKLTVGFYKITEMTPPPGYVLPIDANFFIEVTETGINLLTKEAEKKPSQWDKTKTEGGIVKTFTAKTDSANAQATVENTPGTQLPRTGGIGTTLFTALGGLVTVTAGVILTIRRRKRKTAES